MDDIASRSSAIGEQLRQIDEQLADLAYSVLSSAMRDGETKSPADERKIQQARRGVSRAITALDAIANGSQTV